MPHRDPFLVRRGRIWMRRVSRTARTPLTDMRRRAATGIGAILLGLVALAFASAGDLAQHWFSQIASRWTYAPLLMCPAIFAGVAWLCRKHAPEARGSGIPQVIAAARFPESRGTRALVSLRVAFAKLALTVMMLFGGGSVGREGPTVQISAAIMVFVHRVLKVRLTAGVYIAGGAAGVAAAFNTPLAGVAFAIEELAAAYEQRVAVLVMGAVMIAGLVSLGIAGDYVYFGVMRETIGVWHLPALALVAGVLGGLAGGLFSRLVLSFSYRPHPWISRAATRPVLFAAGCGLVVAVLGLLTSGATWGTGYETTRDLVEGDGGSLWIGPAKLLATLATTLSGTPGGIFAPSLSVGAGFGNVLTLAFPESPTGPVILLGMVAYFVGVVRAPLTAVIILMEATASRGMIIPLFATALIADAVSAAVCRERLYHGLAKPFLAAAKTKTPAPETGVKPA